MHIRSTNMYRAAMFANEHGRDKKNQRRHIMIKVSDYAPDFKMQALVGQDFKDI